MKFEYPIPVPPNAMTALGQLGKQPTNPGLLFDRFTPNLGQASSDKEKSKWKNEALKVVRDHVADKSALDNYKSRWEQVITQAHAKSFKMKTDWRFIAGLGRKGALEIGFTFHRYGFAILPGSSVKGIARASAFYTIAEKLGLEGAKLSELEKALSEDDAKKHTEKIQPFSPTDEAKELVEEFRKVFGTTGEAGGAAFFDAIPEKPPTLKLDIINPHYPVYYNDKKNEVYPTNWQSPVPVFFLTVNEGQAFCFAVGWRGRLNERLHNQAEGWLKHGLTSLGAGAKTSAGYGYFKETEASTRAAAPPAAKQPVEIPAGYIYGRVKEFGDTFGKIQPEGGGSEIFVHKNELHEGISTLQPGQRVAYRKGRGRNNKEQALDVIPGN